MKKLVTEGTKEIKKIIDKFIIPGYHYKTNFSGSEFLVDIESKLIIIAKPVCTDKDFHYDFVLDTQFLSKKKISYQELVMIKNIIEVLEGKGKISHEDAIKKSRKIICSI